MRKNRGPKRTDIQALRAIAVLAVVIYHLWPKQLQGGFVGVDIFFVISGYLMTLTLLRDVAPVLIAKEKPQAIWYYLVNFYARRVKRLVPAASVTLLAILGAVSVIGNYTLTIETTKQIFSSALFFQNWQLASDAVDYIAATNDPTAVQHFWSLSLEEQFYAAWPLVLLVILLFTANLSILYKKSRTMGAILPTAILIGGFFIYGWYLTKNDAAAAYFVTFARVWELLLGGALVFLPALKNYDYKLLLPWAGAAMFTYSIFTLDGTNFPGWHALIPVIGTALVIYGGTGLAESKLSFGNLLKAKPIQWIGDISYSLYLWHWPLIVLLPLLLGVPINGPFETQFKVVILLLSFITAWLSYKFVEIPAQKIKIKKRFIYSAFFVIVGGIAGSAYLVNTQTETKVESELTTLHSMVGSYSDNKCIGAKWQYYKDSCKNGFGQINKSFAQFTLSDHYRKVISSDRTCSFYDYRAAKFNNPSYYCVVGDSTSEYQITVYGDSHTSHWTNALDDLGKRNNIRIVTMDNHICGSEEILQPQCQERLEHIRALGILDKSKYVIISSMHVSKNTKNRKLGNLDLIISTLAKTTSTPLYVLEDTPPASRFIGPDCITYNSPCKRKVAGAIDRIKEVSDNAVEAGIISRDHIIPTHDFFCNKTHCYSLIGGLSVYFNQGKGPDITNSHMTASFSLSLSLPLEKRLKEYGIVPNS